MYEDYSDFDFDDGYDTQHGEGSDYYDIEDGYEFEYISDEDM